MIRVHVAGALAVEVEFSAEEAAALKRFAQKSNREHALSVLYAHVAKPIREEQASAVLSAFVQLERALEGVSTFPWIESGQAR